MVLRALLDRIQGIRRTDDPVFGSLCSRSGATLWEGKVHFEPTGDAVDLLLDGGPLGPTAAQRGFYAEFSSRYSGLLAEIIASIPQLQNPDTDAQVRAAAELRLVCIDLQSADPFSGITELTLEHPADSELFSIQLRNWVPRLVKDEAPN